MMIAPGRPMFSSHSKVIVNIVSPAVNGVLVVTHFSTSATFPSFPRKLSAKHHKIPSFSLIKLDFDSVIANFLGKIKQERIFKANFNDYNFLISHVTSKSLAITFSE